MGCGEACPFVPGLQREDWNVLDPKGQPLERGRIEPLIAEEGLKKADS
jgi:hypothetical protein